MTQHQAITTRLKNISPFFYYSWLCYLLFACSAPEPDYFHGYVEADSTRIATPIAGYLNSLPVARGQTVKSGDLLFVLEQESEQASQQEALARLQRTQSQLDNLKKGKRPSELDALRAQLKQARVTEQLSLKNFKRYETLLNKGFIAKARVDEAKTLWERDQAKTLEIDAQLKTAQLSAREDDIKAAEAEVAAARAVVAQANWKLKQKAIYAKTAGIIEDTLYRPSEWVAAGSPVVTLLAPNHLKIRFFVPETKLGSLKIGQTVTINCDGCAHPMKGQITFISSQAEYTPPVIYSRENRAKLVYLVEVKPLSVNISQLHPGQPVDLHLQ